MQDRKHECTERKDENKEIKSEIENINTRKHGKELRMKRYWLRKQKHREERKRELSKGSEM